MMYTDNLLAAIWILRSGTSIVPMPAEYLESEKRDFKYRHLGTIRKPFTLKQEVVSRRDFAERLQAIIDRYNSGASSTENYYDELVNFAESMKAEDERSVREGLTDDELEIFDLLKKEKMTEAETQKVKLAAKALLKRILEEHPRVLIEDWFRESQTRQIVKDALAEVLDATLPETYDKQLFQRKRDDVFEVILDYALSGAKFAA